MVVQAAVFLRTLAVRTARVRQQRSFLAILYIETIILPRQAPDKRRENSKTDVVFLGPHRHRHGQNLSSSTRAHQAADASMATVV